MNTLRLVKVSDIFGGAILLNYFITRHSEYFTTGHNVVILWGDEGRRYVLCYVVFLWRW